jgi:rare lipoprotein A (peptidoglycan hydrolase)
MILFLSYQKIKRKTKPMPRKNNLKRKYILFSLVLLAFFLSWKFFIQEKRVLGISAQANEIILNDNGIEQNFKTNATSIKSFLDEQNIVLNNQDLIYPKKDTKVFPGLQIKIERIKNLLVEVDGGEKTIAGFEKTVEDILKENNIDFKEEDIIKPSRKSFAYNNLAIKITRVEIEEELEEESIAYRTIEEKDDDLGWRTRKITQKGEKGIKEIKYEVAYHDGEEVSRKIIDTTVTKDPVNEVVTQGTYVKLGKSHTGQGTWYDQSPYPNLMKRYPFTGNMFAANPWLPLGSYAKVTNKANGKSIIVRINDRGPFVDNRIIDLNKVAFAKIASIGAGVIDVKMEEIKN